ncbi:MAG: hypothetical protein ABI648_17720 [Betaproteobacteria bacterium]
MSMLFVSKTPLSLLAAGALLGLLSMPTPSCAESAAVAPVEAKFRGCESAGWCRFSIDSADSFAGPVYRVRPAEVPRTTGEEALSTAIRDRLNALLSDMIHQAKHIVLHDLRKLDDGTFSATVTVNGVDSLASDPILEELRAKVTGTRR